MRKTASDLIGKLRLQTSKIQNPLVCSNRPRFFVKQALGETDRRRVLPVWIMNLEPLPNCFYGGREAFDYDSIRWSEEFNSVHFLFGSRYFWHKFMKLGSLNGNGIALLMIVVRMRYTILVSRIRSESPHVIFGERQNLFYFIALVRVILSTNSCSPSNKYRG